MYDASKFVEFDKLIANTKRDGIKIVIVHHPHVLGDTYEELTVNLDKLAATELLLQIVPPSQRDKPKLDPRRN